MAYMDRGDFSSFSGGSDDGFPDNDSGNNRRSFYIFNHYYFIDTAYILYQSIALGIVLAIIALTYIIKYQPSITDPIEETKSIILNSYIGFIISIFVLTVIVNIVSKNKRALVRRIIEILIISIIGIITFTGIKMNLDSKYTKSEFEKIYEQENINIDNKTRYRISVNGIEQQSQKDYYVDECVKAYKVFTYRMYGEFGLNVLLIALLIYQASRISKSQDIKDRLSKDDKILYDEEINVKY